MSERVVCGYLSKAPEAMRVLGAVVNCEAQLASRWMQYGVHTEWDEPV